MIVLAFLAQTLRIAIPYLFAASGGVMSRARRPDRARPRGLHARRRVLRRARRATTAAVRGSGCVGAVVGGAALALLYARDARSASRRPGRRRHRDQSARRSARRDSSCGCASTARRTRRASRASASSSRAPDSCRSSTNPLVWLGVLAVAGTAWLLYRTPFGLRVRAVGEHPAAAVSVGVPVDRVRYIAAALSRHARRRSAARTSRSTSISSARR